MKLSTLLSIIGLSLSSICIIVNIFTASSQFNFSNKIAKEFQQMGGEGAMSFYFLVITYIGFPVLPLLPLIPLFILKDKWVPFKIAFLFAIGGYIIGLLKIIYGGPRPWWVGLGIKVYGQCSVTDYGRPSGHAFISLYAFMLMFQYYIYEDQSKPYSERIITQIIDIEALDDDSSARNSDASAEETKTGLLKKKQKMSTLEKPQFSEWDGRKTTWLVLGIILCFVIGLSRVYLGAHSIEQILLGWSYATIFYIFTVYKLDDQTDRLLLYFLDGRHRHHNLKILVGVVLMYIFTLMLPLVILVVTDAAREADKKAWFANMILQCKYNDEFPINSASLYLCVVASAAWAMVLGLMFAKTNIMLTPDSLTVTKRILRKLVAIVVYGVFAAVLLYGLKTTSYVVYYLVNLNLCLLFIVLSAYLLLPRLFVALKLSEGLQVDVLDTSNLAYLTDNEP